MCQTVEVAHTTADKTVEDEDVAYKRQMRVFRQVGIVERVPFLDSQIERVSIDGRLAAVQFIEVAVRVAHLLAPVQEHTVHIHRIDKGRIRYFSAPVVPAHLELLIELGVLLAQQVFIDKVVPEVVHIFQRKTLYEEREVRLAVNLAAICLIACNLALEVQNASPRPRHAVVRLPILVYAGKHRGVASLVSLCRLQRVLDGLTQPVAVGLAHIEAAVYLGNDCRNLLRNPFLFFCGNDGSAPVCQRIVVPILVIDGKLRDDLDIDRLLADTEADVRHRRGILRNRFFDGS